MAIDWTKPIETDEGLRFIPTLCDGSVLTIHESMIVGAVVGRTGVASGCNVSLERLRNIPEPKRRGELFIDVIEERPGAPLLYRLNGGEVRSNRGHVLATVKIGEWEEGQ